MKLLQLNCVLPIVLVCIHSGLAIDLETVYEWKYIDYNWPSDSQKQDAIDSGKYDHTKILLSDALILPSDGRVFIVTSRTYDNPASLSTISTETADNGPLLDPYPDWSWHTKTDCTGITSVSRVILDDDKYMWFVDSGKIGTEQVCPAKILKFDTTTNEPEFQVEIPTNLTYSPYNASLGRLEIQMVEKANDSSGNFWVYITDMEGFAVLVWDGTDIWRLNYKIFASVADGETATLNGETMHFEEGPQTIVQAPAGYLDKDYFLIKTLTSMKSFMLANDDVHNSKNGEGIPVYMINASVPTQEPAKATSSKAGLVVASLLADSAIICWNMRHPAEEAYYGFLVTNTTTLRYIRSMKIFTEEDGTETLLAVSNRRVSFDLGTMDWTDYNYRVLKRSVTELISGTVCETGSYEAGLPIDDKNVHYYTTTENSTTVPFEIHSLSVPTS